MGHFRQRAASDALGMSASFRSRPNLRTAAIRRGVPIPDLSRCSKLSKLYSITSSARANSVGGTSRPSALAVLRLMASSYLVGACTGKSAAFSPFKMEGR
jgi:hypothetical protein